MHQESINRYFTEHRQDLIDAVCRLIRFESVKGMPEGDMPFGSGPAAVLKEALSMAKEMGFSTHNYENYIGAVDLQDGARQLDILVHLDVVPAGDGWTITEPFCPVIQDGCLYGRGSADDKGPAVAALFAMKAVKDLGIPLRKSVRLLLGTDEENGCGDTEYYYAREAEAPMTISPDASYPVIYIEKGGLQPTFYSSWKADNVLPRVRTLDGGVKGNVIPSQATMELEGFDRCEIETLLREAQRKTDVAFSIEALPDDALLVTATGSGAHASLPTDGNNALTALLELAAHLPAAPCEGFKKISALHELFPHGDWRGNAAGVAMSDELSGELTICLNVLHYQNGSLTGAFDSRIPLCGTKENVRDVLDAKLTEFGICMEPRRQYPAHHIPADSPLVTALMKCYRQYTGCDDKPIAIGGATYVHGFKNGVAFGCSMPGTNNRMHGPDEFAVIEELIVSAKIFTQVIIDLCS